MFVLNISCIREDGKNHGFMGLFFPRLSRFLGYLGGDVNSTHTVGDVISRVRLPVGSGSSVGLFLLVDGFAVGSTPSSSSAPATTRSEVAPPCGRRGAVGSYSGQTGVTKS